MGEMDRGESGRGGEREAKKDRQTHSWSDRERQWESGREREGGEKGTEGETVMQIDIDVPPNNVTTVPYTIPPLNMLIAFLFIVWAPPP